MKRQLNRLPDDQLSVTYDAAIAHLEDLVLSYSSLAERFQSLDQQLIRADGDVAHSTMIETAKKSIQGSMERWYAAIVVQREFVTELETELARRLEEINRDDLERKPGIGSI